MALIVILAALSLLALFAHLRPTGRDLWLDDLFMNCDRPGGYPPTRSPMFPGSRGYAGAGLAELRPITPLAERPSHDEHELVA